MGHTPVFRKPFYVISISGTMIWSTRKPRCKPSGSGEEWGRRASEQDPSEGLDGALASSATSSSVPADSRRIARFWHLILV